MSSMNLIARALGVLLSLATPLLASNEAGSPLESPSAPEAKSKTTTLSVSVKGLRNDKGRVAVALFNRSKEFPDQQHAFQGKVVKSSKKRALVKFSSLPPGTYALAILHDENKNDKMDFNFLGMPLEGYGFSNDASEMFGPPSFEDASFKVSGEKTSHTVTAQYFAL